jgi:hypothetical protein
MKPRPVILAGLSVRIAGVTLAAILDEEAGTARIQQTGEAAELGSVIEEQWHLLVQRVQRTRPDLRMID